MTQQTTILADPNGADLALAGRRATVMGLGRHGGGVAATRFLAAQGAPVTVTDAAPEVDLAESLAAIADIELAAVHLGCHTDEAFQDAELVVVNPAVRPGNRWIELARAQGATITSEIELLLERVPCPVIGVTGSNGKSTTATMIAAILSAAGRTTWLGGNIERSLLMELSRMTPDDWVVLELSSFQLQWLSAAARLPDIAVVTNCTPNHLDWHGDFEHYATAKRRLLSQNGLTVLGPSLHDAWGQGCPRKVIHPYGDAQLPALKIPGRHNRENASCAAAATRAAGCSDAAIAAALTSFAGLPHRLETVTLVDGRRFINDTQATTPEATIAALEAVPGPIWLLCGGADKGVSFAALAEAIVARCAGAACYGTVGEQIARAIRQHNGDFPCTRLERLDEAVAWCWARSTSGDAIVLSPACASTDQYRDYSHRAADFRKVAGTLRVP